MAANQNGLVLTNDARVFVAEGGIGCGRAYDYHSCMKVTGLSKSYGESTPFYCPDPGRSGKFIEIATIQGEESRWTATMVGPKPFGIRSILERLARRRGCEFNIQVHIGRCIDPTQFGVAQQIIVIEGARISDYSTTDLVALNPGETAPVEETVSFSARDVYELFAQNVFRAGQSLTVSRMALSVAYCPGYGQVGCGDDCSDCESSCNDYYTLLVPHITNPNGQSIFIGHTHDGGVTWSSYQIPCSAVVTNPLETYEIVCAGDKVLVTMNEFGGEGHLFTIPTANIINGVFTGTTFFNVGFTINDQWYHQGIDWLVGEDGIITAVDTISLTSTVIESGSNFPVAWASVHGIDNDNIIFGGGLGQFAYRRKGSALQAKAIIFGGVTIVNNIYAVAMKSPTDWYVGFETGEMYCTSNCGATWAKSSTFPGCIKAIKFATANVGYVVIGSPAALYRTIDGGTTWKVIEDSDSQMPGNTVLHDIAVCPDDPNHFIATGRVTLGPIPDACDIGAVSDTGDSGVILVGRV